MEILSIVLSIIALVVSAIGVTVTIVTAKLQYKRNLTIEVESDCADFAFVNGKQEMVTSFVYTITNIGNLPVYIKEIGFIGFLDDGIKPEMVEISHWKPCDEGQLVKVESQNSVEYLIEMKSMSHLIKDCIIKHNIRNFIACVKCSNGKIYKCNFGNVKKFYKAYFYQFETMPEYY